MNKLAMISLSLVSLAGVALAQNAPAKGAPAVPPEAKKAPPPAEKAPAPPATPPAAPPKAEPPAELADFAKNMGGTRKCTGQAEIAGQMMDVKATITHKVDTTLNKFWVQSSFTGTAGKLPPMKFVMYTTYDATAKKLWRTSVNGRGGHSWGWGTIADKKVTWEGEARWPAMGDKPAADVKTRDTDEMVSPKEVKVVGEYSKDGGKTWSKDHEATCKK